MNEKLAQHAHLTAKSKNKTQNPPAGTAQLTYYIFEGILVGTTDNEFLHVTAWSGGAGGSKNTKKGKARTQTSAVNNPYMYGLKAAKDESVPGGPIPPGSYHIHPPQKNGKVGLSARLDIPPGLKQVNNRDGFLIHGQGRLGSDGCIVIPSENFQMVMDKLTKSQGGHLQVLESLDGSFA